jgi:hypothetical protein
MLPPPLFSSYRQYKQDTDAVASWLVVTAKAHGYPADLLSNEPAPAKSSRLKGKARKLASQNQQKPDKPSAARKYTVAIKDFASLAGWIASRQPPVAVPSAFASVIDRVIKVRSSFGDDMASHGHQPDEASNRQHNYFLGILEKVRDVLRPRMPAGVAEVLPQRPEEHLNSVFAALHVYEPATVADSPTIPLEQPTSQKAEENVVYEAEQQTSMVEAISLYAMMWADLQRIRDRIRWIWSNYRAGVFDVAVAAVSTNSAIDLARNLIDEVLPALGPHPVFQVATKLFFTMCMLNGFDIDRVLNARGQPEPITYDIQDDLFLVAYNLLRSLADVLTPDLPLYKDNTFGTYRPESNRDDMTGTEKFQEDQILLCEVFTELVTANRLVAGYPIQDEFMRGIKEMDRTRDVPFHLVFAAQVFLDIHHILREDATRPFEQMMEQITLMGESIRDELEFHKGVKLSNWTPQNDRALDEIGRKIQWVSNDPIYRSKRRVFLRQMGVELDEDAHRNRLLRSSPVVAGLVLFHFRACLFTAGIAAANAFGSISYTWHLYNAAHRLSLLPKGWKDMQLLYQLLGASDFHVGDAPGDPYECLKRFCLQMGVSVAAFATQKQSGRRSTLASRAGPRSFETKAPVNHMFTDRYVRDGQQFDWTPEYLEAVLSAGKWEVEETMEEGGTFSMVQSDQGSRPAKKGPKRKSSGGGKLSADSLIESLTCALQAETVEFAFPYLAFHRKCWQILRDVRKTCDSLLIEKFTPAYMERESELPWVVGYIFLAAAGSVEGSTRLRDMRLLQVAAGCLEGVIEKGSDEVLKIMADNMDLVVEVEMQEGDEE